MSETTTAGWSDDAMDLSGVPTEYTPPAPIEGIVSGVIVDAEPALSGKGKAMIKVVLKATRYFNGADLDQSVKVWDNSVLFDASFRLAQLIAATGVEAPENRSKEAAEELCEQLVGAEVIFRARVGAPYKGKPGRTEVDRYLTSEQAQEALSAQENADELPRRGRAS